MNTRKNIEKPRTISKYKQEYLGALVFMSIKGEHIFGEIPHIPQRDQSICARSQKQKLVKRTEINGKDLLFMARHSEKWLVQGASQIPERNSCVFTRQAENFAV